MAQASVALQSLALLFVKENTRHKRGKHFALVKGRKAFRLAYVPFVWVLLSAIKCKCIGLSFLESPLEATAAPLSCTVRKKLLKDLTKQTKEHRGQRLKNGDRRDKHNTTCKDSRG